MVAARTDPSVARQVRRRRATTKTVSDSPCAEAPVHPSKMVTSGRPARAKRPGIDANDTASRWSAAPPPTRRRGQRSPGARRYGGAGRTPHRREAGAGGRRAANRARCPTSRYPGGWLGRSRSSAISTPSGVERRRDALEDLGLLGTRERLEDEVHEQGGIEPAGSKRDVAQISLDEADRAAEVRVPGEPPGMLERGSAHVNAGHRVAERGERHGVQPRAATGVEDPRRRTREQPAQASNLRRNHSSPPARAVVGLVEVFPEQASRVLGSSPVQLGDGVDGPARRDRTRRAQRRWRFRGMFAAA